MAYQRPPYYRWSNALANCRNLPTSHQKSCDHTAGFTLVEMLVVISIIAVLVALIAPSTKSILTAQGINSARVQVMDAIEFARSEALSKNSYVWIALKNTPGTENSQLKIGIVRSIDGTANLQNGTVLNYTAVGKVLSIDNTNLITLAGLGQPVGSKVTAACATANITLDRVVDLADTPGTSPPTFAVGTQTFTATNSHAAPSIDCGMILFTPQGEATLGQSTTTATSGTTYATLIHVGLKATRGKYTADSDVNTVALLLYGSSGQVQIVRL